MPPLPMRKVEAASVISAGSVGGAQVMTGPSPDWFVRKRLDDPTDDLGLSIDPSAADDLLRRKEGVILWKNSSSRGYLVESLTSLKACLVSPWLERFSP